MGKRVKNGGDSSLSIRLECIWQNAMAMATLVRETKILSRAE